MRIPKLKSASKLALFSTGMIIAAVAFIYSSSILLQAESGGQGIIVTIILLVIIVSVSFVISSLLVDKILNPVRLMIKKVKDLAEKDFSSKIFIDSAEDELREYAVAFNDMSSKINEYIEKQKQFISDASHELVTPITVIVGHTDMLMRWAKDDKEALDKGLQIIKSEALAMNELVENLLFFARTDNKKIEYIKEEINLTDFLQGCTAEQRMLHPDFEITFAGSAGIPIFADTDALRRVMRIIFANSVKYSLQKRKISVAAKVHGQFVDISITDSGIGMSPEYLDKIFDRFYRIDDSRTKGTGGTGLGLAIAKEIVLAHGGMIFAESEIDKGTTISITIPVKALA